MTNKEQIIIDGVDVSKCIHIDRWKHCNCCNDLIKTIYPNATQCRIEEDLRCETYPNCYFKQIKKFWFELALEMSGGLEHSNFNESAEQLWQMAVKYNMLNNDIINEAKGEENAI